ncbi:pyroglutamyl-peptidase I [Nonomuraea sp. NPDC049152]|uniref:pyroglutamyl-peptidase I n=1 Tax=Nonomuraea sp. NPDC049152 TaxID=3154350 RepID=UPI0033E5295C
MSHVLVTGFEPFGGETTNPSYDAALLVPGATAVELPCVFADALAALREAVERHDPALVLCTGQAGGRAVISVEKVAINLIEARIPDNAGAQPSGEPVVKGGPDAYLSTLPVKAMVRAVRAEGIPAAVSYTAGTFVCNQVAYGLAHLIATERPGLRGGFVHVPYAPHQVTETDRPSMETATVARALTALVKASDSIEDDLPEGAIQ